MTKFYDIERSARTCTMQYKTNLVIESADAVLVAYFSEFQKKKIRITNGSVIANSSGINN